MKHYKQENNNYSFYDINTIMCILGVVVFALSLKTIITYPFTAPVVFNDYIKFLSPVWILLSIFFMAVGVKQMSINPKENLLAIKYLFGIYTQKYTITQPLKTQVINNLKNGKTIEIDILIQTDKGMIKFQSYSPTYRNRIDEFLSETEQIFKD